MFEKFFGEKFFEQNKGGHSKIFKEVFDYRTFISIKNLYMKKSFDEIIDIISTGKEANVFLAKRKDQLYAIKIFRRETSSFKKSEEYVKGDPRYKFIKKKEISKIMANKEFRNLKLAFKNKAYVPRPLLFKDNIVMMDYLGDSERAPRLYEINAKDYEEIIIKSLKNNLKALNKANLVHADLSEYNMLLYNKKVYFIDFSQAVLKEHPKADYYYRRDLNNIKKFLDKNNINKDFLEEFI